MLKKVGLIFIVLIFPLSFLLFFGLALDHKFKTLPYYHPSEILLDSTNNDLGKTYFLPNKEFVNHNGDKVSIESLKDNVYLLAPYSLGSEYISVITKRLLTANFKYTDEDNIKIIGLNTDGVIQDEEKLKDYMINLNRNVDETDNFLYLSTTSKEAMEDFITKELGIVNLNNSAITLLIDSRSQIRGRYNLNAERQINDAIEDIALLRKEIDIERYEANKVNSNN
tara:strand:- start:10499 stop:11173 length:675 start_codon:yes stop_codon:yes gene_type:complete